MQSIQSRRRFLATLSSAGAAHLVGASASLAEEGPPETTTVRLAKAPSICTAPQYVADELLRAEGFTDVRFVEVEAGVPMGLAVARGDVDFTANFAPALLIPIDAGEPITIVGGEHIGCFELFAREGIRSIPDLKGKNVGVQSLGSPQHLFISTMAAHVGLDAGKDIRWVTGTSPRSMELFAAGEIDAFLGFPRRGRSMPSWAFRPSHRTCARVASAASSSTVSSTDPGLSIFAACWARIRITPASIRSPPNAYCGRS
jgi:NitT/TauT family transport system substrate-binding protein